MNKADVHPSLYHIHAFCFTETVGLLSCQNVLGSVLFLTLIDLPASSKTFNPGCSLALLIDIDDLCPTG
jgi:hypothetical protein